MSSEKRPQDAARRAAEEIARGGMTAAYVHVCEDPMQDGPAAREEYTQWAADIIQRAIDSATPPAEPAGRTFEEWWATDPVASFMGNVPMLEGVARAAFEAGAASARGEGWVSVEERLPNHHSFDEDPGDGYPVIAHAIHLRHPDALPLIGPAECGLRGDYRGWFWYRGIEVQEGHRVTHWRPLPEPPTP